MCKPVRALLLLLVTAALAAPAQAKSLQVVGYAGLMANEGVNISLLYGAVSFIVGAIGGLVWILSAEKAAQGAAASNEA